MKLIVIICFIQLNISKILSFPHIIYINQYKNYWYSISFFSNYSKSAVHFTLSGYFNLDQPHLKWSVVTRGSWLTCWMAQLLRVRICSSFVNQRVMGSEWSFRFAIVLHEVDGEGRNWAEREHLIGYSNNALNWKKTWPIMVNRKGDQGHTDRDDIY